MSEPTTNFHRSVQSLALEFPEGSRWRHHTGREYEVVAIANAANPNPRYPIVVVFKSVVNGNWWTKTAVNFRERMTRIP